ncbi:SWIM zinc finger family protein [Streptomyces iakyrus]|uniref:SWIM zinc finger family protein n=1 Tax=Streptomyces iakyrus TaxID=68219 RepID=UPI0036EE602F
MVTPEADGGPEAAGAPRIADTPEGTAARHTADAREGTGAAAATPGPRAAGGPQPSPAGATPPGAAPVRSAAGAGTEPRAADVAREALRAARDDARRAREETEREGARRRRRARQRHVDDRAAAARRAAAPGSAAQDVRRFLSDAFRMPDSQDPTSDDRPGVDVLGPEVSREVPGGEHGLAESGEEAPGREHGLTERGPEAQDGAGSPGSRPESPDASAEADVSGVAGSGPVAPTGGPAQRGPDPAAATDAPTGIAASGLADPRPAAPTDGPVLRDPGAVAGTGARAETGAPGLAGPGPVPPTDGPALLDPDTAAGTGASGPRDSDPAVGPDVPPETVAPGLAGPGPAVPTDGPALPDADTAAPAPRHYAPSAGPDAPPPGHAPTPPPSHAPLHHPAQPHSVAAGPEPVSTATTTPASRSTPRAARSMAAPARDHELRRTFPPFPPRDGDRFAESWWGNAWVGALEQGALDVKRLERGRGYAGQGHVDAITVTPGLVLAYVQGSRPRPYRVQVRLRTLDDTDWDRFLEAAADRPGHIAALLDKEMPQSLAECGVPLLPGPGDLEPRCSCPDRGHPCKHAAALCYQTARLLDADPFVLLLLRGRGERELLDALSRLNATRAARAALDKGPAPLPGVRAAEVLAARALPPLPAPLPPPAHPEQPPAYPAAPGGPDPFALDQLATDAAARAHALLGTGRDPVGQLTFWQDAVRLAAARPGAGLTAGTRSLYASLASAAGRTPSELARAVAAWRQGGLEGLAVLEEPWDPPAGRFDRARPLLLAADLPAFRPWRNRLTHPRGHLQLRLGRDGLWYAYESEPGHDDWWPRGTPDLDPVGALTGLGLPSDF